MKQIKQTRTKRGFTLIELIFSIVILAIIGMIGAEIVSRVFERYAATRDMERAQSDLRRTLDILAARLSYRVKNSTVAYDTNGDAAQRVVPPYQPNNNAWLLPQHEALMWLGIAYESQRGSAAAAGGAVIPGWSGIGLRLTPPPDPYAAIPVTDPDKFSSPLSDLEHIAKPIEQTQLEGIGVTAADAADPFGNQLTVLVFAGRDWRGDTPAGDDTGLSVGFKYKSWNWDTTDANNNNYSYYKIAPQTDGNFTITAVNPVNPLALHPPSYSDPNNIASYYLVRSAYAVWVENGNLMLAYNFRPWLGDTYQTISAGGDTMKQILLTDVTNFSFEESGDVLRLNLCVKASDWAAMGNNDDNSTQFCRERTVL